MRVSAVPLNDRSSQFASTTGSTFSPGSFSFVLMSALANAQIALLPISADDTTLVRFAWSDLTCDAFVLSLLAKYAHNATAPVRASSPFFTPYKWADFRLPA